MVFPFRCEVVWIASAGKSESPEMAELGYAVGDDGEKIGRQDSRVENKSWCLESIRGDMIVFSQIVGKPERLNPSNCAVHYAKMNSPCLK